MLLRDWCLQSVVHSTNQCESVLCVVPPFITIPGVMEHVFPNAQLRYVSMTPRPETVCPPILPIRRSVRRVKVPLLNLHVGLVRAYWATRTRWKPWMWLEEDFIVLRKFGFRFRLGSIGQYQHVIEIAASQFCNSVKANALGWRVNAIATYGRGHWTMNASALAASELKLPLYVVERGILPDTYIVDRDVPFTAPGSEFRSSWERFRHVKDWASEASRELTLSRWHLYDALQSGVPSKPTIESRHSEIIVGQCMFDYNCIKAPFKTALECVEYLCAHKTPRHLNTADILYRPHPLSPEEYPDGYIRTKFGDLPVDTSNPWDHLANGSLLHTWNSTLGLEAALVFDREVDFQDPDCHYAWVRGCGDDEKRKYVTFLNRVSTPVGNSYKWRPARK